MFTGIVQQVGTIAAREQRGDGARLDFKAAGGLLAGVAPGDSIAVNGCCLTAIEVGADRFSAECSKETLALTTLGALAVGARVNLETALTLGTPLGGHLVAGHVDGVGEVVAFGADGAGDAAGWRLVVRLADGPADGLARFLARKGSIAVDGVSLTVNAADAGSFTCTVVPHTLAHTVFDGYRVGTRVNLEVDLVARYVERLLEAHG
jgi:riboflavin synthase